MPLSFLFRKPVFPVICDIDGYVFAARNAGMLEKRLTTIDADPDKLYHLVDATAEGWSFMKKHIIVSPLSFRKNWTKK